MRARRIGIDLGGTKIEGVVLGADGAVLGRKRIATPRDDYAATVSAVAGLVRALDGASQSDSATIGVAIPGSLSPQSGGVQNANSTWINGQQFDEDLEAAIGRPVRMANDANCFALSEAVDGAGAGYSSVFGVIIGTGCGGGLVIDGRLVNGPRGIGGEWGHNPLPWSAPDEHPGPVCWCGRMGCMEVWVSGPAMEADHRRTTGSMLTAIEIATAAKAGDRDAAATLERHASRLARGLATVVNVFDPEVVVLGGGLSLLEHLYERLPVLAGPHIFADDRRLRVHPPKWGDASGVRGAAWLWDEPHA